MKILRPFDSAGRRSALLIILLVAVASVSAQQRSLQVIPDHSMARVFLGTAENPTSFDVGVANVRGEMQLNPDDLSLSRFNLTIYSADRKDLKVYGERSVITFQSESVEQGKDGELDVSGELTVMQVVANGVAGFGEGGPGSLSANSKRMRTTRRVVFVFNGLVPPAQTSSGSGAVPAQEDKPESAMLVSANTSVDGESFPELLFAVQDVAWPPVADDKNCGTPSAPGQNYSDVTCPVPTSQMQRSADDAAIQEPPPAGNLVTILLTLAAGDSDSAGTLAHRDAVR